MGLRGDIDVPALSSGSPWSHFAVQVVARSVANLRGSWLETFLALTHLGAFSRFFSGESYYLALLWGVEGRTRNSWFIQPTAIWGHDMVFSRSPFLPPRLRQVGARSPRRRRNAVLESRAGRVAGVGGGGSCGWGKGWCTGWCQRGVFLSDGLLGSLDPMNGECRRHDCNGMDKPRPLAMLRSSCSIFLVLCFEQCYAPVECFVSSWFLDLMAVCGSQLQHCACTERLMCFMSGVSR